MCYKILLVDDHLVVKAGVSIILNNEIDNLEISYCKDYFEAIQYLKNVVCDLIILDINIPGGKGIEMIAELKGIVPNVKILMFSGYEADSYALRYIFAGGDGYLNKLSGEDKLVEAVRGIMNTGKYLTADIVSKLNDHHRNAVPINPFDKLSTREMEIAKLLIKGDGNLEIANFLDLKMSTVSTYKNRVFEKLKINNLVELIEKHNLFFD